MNLHFPNLAKFSPSDTDEGDSEIIPAEIANVQSPEQSHGKVCYRILIVDDNPSIHKDFRKILCPASNLDPRADELETLIFGSPAKVHSTVTFELDSALQGQSALEMLKEALREGRPYALAFVDIQMPPGWDGVETVNHLWNAYPGLQVVICTAYSTYSWEDMRSVLKQPDSLLFLKKPFDEAEIQQMAHTLSRKWELNLLAGRGLNRLNESIGNLVIPSGETLSDSVAQVPRQMEEQQFVDILERLGQKLESTRRQLRHAEQQLVHSEKMASLGRLSAGILHEINNPLNYAMAALTVLEEDAKNLPEDYQEDHLDTLKDIRDGCTRMMEITLGLRKFAYPEAADLQQVQVNGAIRTALRLMAVEIGDDITIENRISDDLIIMGAESKLSQVFVNLIHNSTHALRMKTHEPGSAPRILLSAAVLERRTVISITDNGPGIPSEERGKIFDPFFTTKDVGQAVGLGLGICHQILQQFGATLAVESELGTYTRFDISFPAPDSAPSRTEATQIDDELSHSDAAEL